MKVSLIKTRTLVFGLVAAFVVLTACSSDDVEPISPAARAAATLAEQRSAPNSPAEAPSSTPATPIEVAPTPAASEVTPTPIPVFEEPTTIPISPVPNASTPAPVPSQTPTPLLPTQTPAPVPTSTPAPTVAPVADRSLTDEAFAFLERLTSDFSPRESSTEQELAAAVFLESQFAEMGYQTFIQDFTIDRTSSSIDLTSGGDAIRSLPITLSFESVATAPLVDAGKAFEDDVSPGELAGKIALIERGTITFQEKVDRVAQAGAVAAVIYNDRAGPFRGTFANPSSIPAISISRTDGLDLLAATRQRDLSVTVSVQTNTLQSRNVVAEKSGSTGRGIVVLGGHYDTVPDVPGANDNGSGTTAVVTIARAIADRDYPFDVRFVLFGSEETGLFGSRHYVESLSEQELTESLAMLNFDALGSGTILEVLGDDVLTDEAGRLASELGTVVNRQLSLPPNTSSDHAPFEEEGIPVIFFMSNDFSRIHTPEDQMRWINRDLLGQSIEIGIGLLDSMASGG